MQDQPTHNINEEARINSTSDSMEVYNAQKDVPQETGIDLSLAPSYEY